MTEQEILNEMSVNIGNILRLNLKETDQFNLIKLEYKEAHHKIKLIKEIKYAENSKVNQ